MATPTTTDTLVNLVDLAIGTVQVTSSIIQNFDIDAFVHTTVRSQCITLQMIYAAQTADSTLTANRPPVSIQGTTAGGYS